MSTKEMVKWKKTVCFKQQGRIQSNKLLGKKIIKEYVVEEWRMDDLDFNNREILDDLQLSKSIHSCNRICFIKVDMIYLSD